MHAPNLRVAGSLGGRPGKIKIKLVLNDDNYSTWYLSPESEIRFGWGISYNYIGQLHPNLNKNDVVVGLEIPDFRTVTYYTPISTDPQQCRKWHDNFTTNIKVLYETCTQVWPAYLATINKLEHSKERIKHVMEKEIPAVVPTFRLRQHELTTTAYPGIESESYVGMTSRKKIFKLT